MAHALGAGDLSANDVVRIAVCGRREFGEVGDFAQEFWIESFIFISFWCNRMFDIDMVG